MADRFRLKMPDGRTETTNDPATAIQLKYGYGGVETRASDDVADDAAKKDAAKQAQKETPAKK